MDERSGHSGAASHHSNIHPVHGLHHHRMPGQPSPHQHQHEHHPQHPQHQQQYHSAHPSYANSPPPPHQQYQHSPHQPAHPPPPPPPPHQLMPHAPYGMPAPFYAANGVPSAPMMPSNAGMNGQSWPSPHAPGAARRESPKEVKRRTKTGCLTCRKRRIKCDEGQPTCANCRKSKRPCMGYDPVFKSATLSPQPLLRPAPPSVLAPVGPSAPSPDGFTHPGYQHPAATYIPAAAVALPPGRTSLEHAALVPAAYPPSMQPERRAKSLSMDMLFAINDVPPRFELRDHPTAIPPYLQQPLFDFYNFHYAPGLNNLLETTWYTTSAFQHIQQSPHLFNYIDQCMESFKLGPEHVQQVQQNQSLEARLVWELACVARDAARSSQDSQLIEVLNRLDILERLLTGSFLELQRVPPPPQSAQYKQQAFWHYLARFVAARDDTSDPAAYNELQDSFQGMRGALDVIETRDVLYSVAIGRHIGGRMPDFHPPQPLLPTSNDPNDDRNRLRVAHSFVEAEDQRGTTQVIQRICGMAIRGWILQKQS